MRPTEAQIFSLHAMNERAEPTTAGSRNLRLGAVIAVAIAAAFLVWLIFIKDDDNGSSGAAAVPASTEDLRSLSDEVGHKVYWAGPRSKDTYELTRTKDGSIYVRYLPAGVKVGDSRPEFLTIGTYPHKKALDTMRQASKRKGAVTRRIEGGGLAVSNKARPRSTYLAYSSDPDLLLEVYDPSPVRSRQLAESGRVVPVR
jgi:hypothetical protein